MDEAHDEHCEGEWITGPWGGALTVCRCSERRDETMLPDVPITEEEAQLVAELTNDELFALTCILGARDRTENEQVRQGLLDAHRMLEKALRAQRPGITRQQIADKTTEALRSISNDWQPTAGPGFPLTREQSLASMSHTVADAVWALLADSTTPEPAPQPIASGRLLDAVHMVTGDVQLTVEVPAAEYAEWLDDDVEVFVTRCNHLAPTDEHELRTPDPLDEVMAAIGSTPIVIWFCPTDHGHRVEWTTHDDRSMAPLCLDCGQIGATRGGTTPEPEPAAMKFSRQPPQLDEPPCTCGRAPGGELTYIDPRCITHGATPPAPET